MPRSVGSAAAKRPRCNAPRRGWGRPGSGVVDALQVRVGGGQPLGELHSLNGHRAGHRHRHPVGDHLAAGICAAPAPESGVEPAVPGIAPDPDAGQHSRL